jgi:hypothetical protein
MNLTEASEVHAVLRAFFVDPSDAAYEAARTAALRLADRTDRQLAGSGRPRVTRRQIEASAMRLTAEGSGPLLSDPCRQDQCGPCPGSPCQHHCHQKPARAPAQPRTARQR